MQGLVEGSWTYWEETLEGGTLVFVSDICGRCVGLGYWDTGALIGA